MKHTHLTIREISQRWNDVARVFHAWAYRRSAGYSGNVGRRLLKRWNWLSRRFGFIPSNTLTAMLIWLLAKPSAASRLDHRHGRAPLCYKPPLVRG